MKMYTNILTLCFLAHNSIWDVAGFSVNPRQKLSTQLKSSTTGGDYSSASAAGGSGETAAGGALQKPGSTIKVGGLMSVKNIFESNPSIIVQGGALRTWSTPTAERIQLSFTSEGRPMKANIELWQGPDNTPQKLTVYCEDGSVRPLNCVIETPRGPNSIALYNTGQLEFPFSAAVEPDVEPVFDSDALASGLKIIQGGALKTWPFDTAVASVQVLIRTDGRPLNSRIELLQGPNNQKQVLDIYTEDGMERPFFALIETPGSGNVIRVLNTAPMEYPMSASVAPYTITDDVTSAGWTS